MKNTLMAVTAVIFAASVQADPRCNQDINTAHFPYDAGDTDNEYKNSATVVVKEVAGTGAVACHAVTLLTDVPYRVAPDPTTVHSRDAGGACVAVNDDGTEAELNGSWESKITRENCTLRINQSPNQARCDVRYELWCGRFTPRIE